MLVLAFDTSTEAIAVGLGRRDDDGSVSLIGSHDLIARRAALSCTLPAIRALLEEHGCGLSDLGAVAVGRGPGSYTGVRIGMALAKGLAHGEGLPLLGLSSLNAVAWRSQGSYEGLLGVVGDAMRGEVYPALFELSGGLVARLTPDAVSDPAEVAGSWAREARDREILLTGNGLHKYAEVMQGVLGDRARLADEAVWLPSGASAVSAIDGLDETSGDIHPSLLLPVYTNLPDPEAREHPTLRDLPVSGVMGPVDVPDDQVIS